METSGKKLVLALVAIGALVLGAWFLMAARQESAPGSRPTKESSKQSEAAKATSVMVTVGEMRKRIAIPSGDVMDDTLPQPDFSQFSGLPRPIEARGQTSETRRLLSDREGKIVIVNHEVLAKATPGTDPAVVSTGEFTCTLETKSCVRSNIFGARYRVGSNRNLSPDTLWWLGWGSAENRLIGYEASQENRASSVYVCATDTSLCQATQAQGKPVTGNVVPGSLSPSQRWVVLINQNDTPNEVTGKAWEALVYDVTDLAEPKFRYDISLLIDTDANVGYDSVRSVAWEPGEGRIALGTERKIALLDLKSGALTPLFTDTKTDPDQDTWLSDALTFTPDGRFIVFVDDAGVIEGEDAASSTSAAETDTDDPDTLKGQGVPIGALTILPVDGKGQAQSIYEAPELSLDL